MAAAGEMVPARCIEAVDGDTLRVQVAGLLVDVRLLGVDAPEHDQEWGAEARNFAAAWCAREGGLELELDRQERDRYRRTLAWVWSGPELLNASLVRAGLAIPYPWPPNVAHRSEIAAAQAEAQAAGAGFWSRGGLKMSPQAWRSQGKN